MTVKSPAAGQHRAYVDADLGGIASTVGARPADVRPVGLAARVHARISETLKRVAAAIRSAVRDGDVVVRYGGEEFVVIAPATDGDGAMIAAERMRAAVAATATELADGRLVPLTISAGVASLVDETDGRGLFRAADSALLAAKRAGRDCVTRI